MPSLKEKLLEMRDRRSALLATNFYNAETLRGVLEAASDLGQPIILQMTRSSIDYLGLPVALAMGRAGLRHHGVEGWIHLDHALGLDLVADCIDAGFDSVMIDASEQDLDRNIEATRRAVALARATGANVEAELGFVAKLGQEADPAGLTDPVQAARFVEATGVDALAVSIGTAHGFYKAEPRLDLERLEAIRRLTSVPLVLHGGSGVGEASIRAVVARGICKVNVATETKDAFVRGIKRELLASSGIDIRAIFPPAIRDVKELIAQKLRMLMTEGGHA
ncbi:class II fructose-bisphosphate aldolase [Mesoterricola silvestris]|uniref:Fructose-bisphosphate aldolase n=1 Tax=Mesoterricola silvestris TaxID=2927979 RepID=A0AA48GP50_9BACT|nr:class II fructose-bisphosphate aldolase [Mesoterricola silvestris]BDU71580.1 fructose-bisphosphate aldolase [Mesoterricola silvestris]